MKRKVRSSAIEAVKKQLAWTRRGKMMNDSSEHIRQGWERALVWTLGILRRREPGKARER